MNQRFVVLASTILCVFAALATGATASALAQPQYGPPPAYGPGSSHAGLVARGRHGLTFGFGAGIGAMESNDGPVECVDCSDSVSGSIDAHVGIMLNPRLALSFEVWGTGQALDSQADATLVQVLVMGSAKFWLAPRVWIKGGLGTAHLSMTFSDDSRDKLATGAAGMAAVGVELIHRPRFAMDLQLKGGVGNYEGFGDRISQGTLQLGVSWF